MRSEDARRWGRRGRSFGGGGAYNAGGPFGGAVIPFPAAPAPASANSDPRFNQVRDLINRGDLSPPRRR